jgi:nucleoid-associated protein YejK
MMAREGLTVSFQSFLLDTRVSFWQGTTQIRNLDGHVIRIHEAPQTALKERRETPLSLLQRHAR